MSNYRVIGVVLVVLLVHKALHWCMSCVSVCLCVAVSPEGEECPHVQHGDKVSL